SISDGFVELSGTSTSGLPLVYTSLNTEVAIVNGQRLTLIGTGEVEIVASQEGNEEFEPADPVIQVLEVEPAVILSDLRFGNFNIYPNPANDVIHIEVTDWAKDIAIQASLYTLGGKRLMTQSLSKQQQALDVHDISAGVYLLRLDYQSQQHIRKVVIQ
ncbi:MAG: T9SS type A sorting domain-containing protein, partial [Marinoscillum sp.]